MIDTGRVCEQCGVRTMTRRFAIGMAVDAVNLCRTCVEEALDELVEHGAPQHAETGGEG